MQLAINRGQFETQISPDRRDPDQPADRALGRVVACEGARATIAATAGAAARLDPDEAWLVGRMISINLGTTRIVGLVYQIESSGSEWDEAGENPIHVRVELVGEVGEGADGVSRFQSGITTYPPIGAVAHRIRVRDLALVHDLGSRDAVVVGSLTQDETVAATISIEGMLSRHFAIVGTTGVGKSSAVSLLLRRAIGAKPNLRVLILDPHNEYTHAFPDKALTIGDEGLNLPFWMFRIEEFAEAVFRGRQLVDEEVDILREVVVTARQRYRMPPGPDIARDLGSSLLKRSLDGSNVRLASTAANLLDAPTPYRIKDVYTVIDELIGLHELRYSRAALRSLKVRIESLHGDPRYDFMFGRANLFETMMPVISQIFRLPLQGRPITVFQLGGLPSEVVNAVASVLSRLSFDLAMASRGTYEILLLCEEAHRYVPSERGTGFDPTRQAIARIAKEGRKYGAYLGVVTQRPGELDPTILSQCSTIFAMRLANDRDQQIIRSAIADASASTIGFLSSIGNREAIAFGEGVATTMRMRFARLEPHELPAMAGGHGGRPGDGEPDIDAMVRRIGGTA